MAAVRIAFLAAVLFMGCGPDIRTTGFTLSEPAGKGNPEASESGEDELQVRALIESLSSADKSIRETAADRLGRLGSLAGKVIPSLRSEAVRALWETSDCEDLRCRCLLAMLTYDGNWDNWKFARDALKQGLIPPEGIIARLTDPSCRSQAIAALGLVRPGNLTCRDALLRVFRESCVEDRIDAARGLVSHAEETIRSCLAREERAWVPAFLAQALADPSEDVRKIAAEALPLIRHEPEDVFDALLEKAASDPSPNVRLAAAEHFLKGDEDRSLKIAWGIMGGQDAEAAESASWRLCECLENPSRRVKILEMLFVLLENGNPGVRLLAARTLARISFDFDQWEHFGANPGPPPPWLSAELEPWIQRRIMETIRTSDPARIGAAMEIIASFYRIEDERLRSQILAYLSGAIRSVDETVRLQAAKGILRQAGEGDINMLRQVLQALGDLKTSPSPDVRKTCVNRLMNLAEKPAFRDPAATEIEPLLADPEEQIRVRAARSLLILGRTSARAIHIVIEDYRARDPCVAEEKLSHYRELLWEASADRTRTWALLADLSD